MRIGIDAHCLEGNRTGAGRYLASILAEWREHETSHAFFLYFKDVVPSDFISQQNIVARLLPRPFGKRSTALFMHRAIPRAVKDDGIDALFCPEYVAPLRINVPFVLTLHDIVFAAHPEWHFWPSLLDRFLLGYVSKDAARRAARILVPSQFSKSEIKRVWRLPDRNISVTPLAAGSEFAPLDDRAMLAAATQRYGIQGRFIFFVGSAFPRRCVRECMEAFFAIAPEFPGHQFLIVGIDRYPAHRSLAALANELNTQSGRALFVHRSFANDRDLPALYNAAELTIWLSKYEGFGLPLLESLACGTPVITTKAGSIPEVVGECAAFVEKPFDSLAIANVLRTALSDAKTRDSLAHCGIARAAKFSWQQCAAQTLEAIVNARKNS